MACLSPSTLWLLTSKRGPLLLLFRYGTLGNPCLPFCYYYVLSVVENFSSEQDAIVAERRFTPDKNQRRNQRGNPYLQGMGIIPRQMSYKFHSPYWMFFFFLDQEAEWQTLRIEANALEGTTPHLSTTPLRLIANQSKIRVTIKKRLIGMTCRFLSYFFFSLGDVSSDCGMVASRLQVNLDDLLWVLTDSQLNAALVFINSLQDVIKKSNLQSKQLAAEKLKVGFNCLCLD